MASFCGSCGSPLSGNSAFCAQCGAPANGGPRPAAGSPISVTPATGGSSGLKIIVVIVCALAVLGVAILGSVVYVAHRVKQAVVQKAAENGVDLSSLRNESTRARAARHPMAQPCEFLTKEEVSRLIGEPVERAEVQDAMCMYYGPAGLSANLASKNASRSLKQAQTPGVDANGLDVANAVDQMANSLGAQNGQTGSGGELPLLMLAVVTDGKAQMMAVSATKALFGGLGRAADTKGIAFGADIPGLGDKAVRVPKLGLNVLQGEILIRVIPGPFPNADAKTIAIARAVLPKV
jgi:hypothetical protein